MPSLCLVIQQRMRVTHLGFYLRVFVNEQTQNLKKTTSSVLSVLLLLYNITNQPDSGCIITFAAVKSTLKVRKTAD